MRSPFARRRHRKEMERYEAPLAVELFYPVAGDDIEVVEIWYGDYQWAIVSERNGELAIEFDVNPTLGIRTIPLDELERALATARRRLRPPPAS